MQYVDVCQDKVVASVSSFTPVTGGSGITAVTTGSSGASTGVSLSAGFVVTAPSSADDASSACFSLPSVTVLALLAKIASSGSCSSSYSVLIFYRSTKLQAQQATLAMQESIPSDHHGTC